MSNTQEALDVMNMLARCEELGGRRQDESYAQYLCRLIDAVATASAPWSCGHHGACAMCAECYRLLAARAHAMIEALDQIQEIAGQERRSRTDRLREIGEWIEDTHKRLAELRSTEGKIDPHLNENSYLRMELGRLRSALRVNMLRHGHGDKEIDRIINDGYLEHVR